MFNDLGRAQFSGMGIAPLPMVEIHHYGGLTDADCRLVRRMSVAYVEGLHLGRDPFAKSPMEIHEDSRR